MKRTVRSDPAEQRCIRRADRKCPCDSIDSTPWVVTGSIGTPPMMLAQATPPEQGRQQAANRDFPFPPVRQASVSRLPHISKTDVADVRATKSRNKAM